MRIWYNDLCRFINFDKQSSSIVSNNNNLPAKHCMVVDAVAKEQPDRPNGFVDGQIHQYVSESAYLNSRLNGQLNGLIYHHPLISNRINSKQQPNGQPPSGQFNQLSSAQSSPYLACSGGQLNGSTGRLNGSTSQLNHLSASFSSQPNSPQTPNSQLQPKPRSSKSKSSNPIFKLLSYVNDMKGGDCVDCSKNPIESSNKVIVRSDSNENVISDQIYLNNNNDSNHNKNQLENQPNDLPAHCIRTSLNNSQDDTAVASLKHQRLTNLDFHLDGGNKFSRGEFQVKL